MTWGDFSRGPVEFLTFENPPAGDSRYTAGDNPAGETILHDTEDTDFPRLIVCLSLSKSSVTVTQTQKNRNGWTMVIH